MVASESNPEAVYCTPPTVTMYARRLKRVPGPSASVSLPMPRAESAEASRPSTDAVLRHTLRCGMRPISSIEVAGGSRPSG